MPIKKVKDGYYEISHKRTINGEIYRTFKRISTELKGKELDLFLKSKEIKELEKLYKKAEEIPELSNYTYKQFSEWFINTRDAKEKTKDMYRYILLHPRVIKKLGKLKMTDIKIYHTRDLFKDLKELPSDNTGKILSPKTLKHFKDTISSLFNVAIGEVEIITSNPMTKIKTPKVNRTLENKFYTFEEIQDLIILAFEKGTVEYQLGLLITFFGGLRPNELTAIKKEKININTSIIKIDSAISWPKNSPPIYSTTKEEDIRDLKINPFIESLILRHIENEKVKSEVFGNESEFLFTNPEGNNHKHRSYWTETHKKFCKENDFRYISWYGLRHTTATLLAAKGIPSINIGTKLGHIDPNTTKFYIHATKTIDEEVQDIIEDTFTPKLFLIK